MPDKKRSRSRSGVTSAGRRAKITLVQVLVVVVVLSFWEFVPRIDVISSNVKFLNPFFISSPTEVARELWDLVTGSGGVNIWSYVWPTFTASVAGTLIGMFAGGFIALVLSSFPFLGAVFRPFMVAANAVPRIALMPIIVILFGLTIQASIVIAVMVVFFIALFNAFEGASTVDRHLIQNAEILDASKWDIMRTIRFPYALAWTLASLPVAITLALLSVVTGEVLTGVFGLGRLISTATATAQADLTFAVVVVLATLAMLLFVVAEEVKRRVLHWWGQG